MKAKTIFVCLTASLLSSCGGIEDTSKVEAAESIIAEAAGMLARNLAYSEGQPRWSPPPGPVMIGKLEALSETSAYAWPLFFRLAADSAAKLEQLEIQARQEEAQLQLL